MAFPSAFKSVETTFNYSCNILPIGHVQREIAVTMARNTQLNVQPDHLHLLVQVPPKMSISELMGVLKGRSAIRIFTQFPSLRKRPYWGDHFWGKGYCVDTVGLNSEMIKKYVRFEENGNFAR